MSDSTEITNMPTNSKEEVAYKLAMRILRNEKNEKKVLQTYHTCLQVVYGNTYTSSKSHSET